MRSKCLPTFYSVTRHQFIDINFPYDVESFTVRRCLLPDCGDFSVRMHSFDHITTSGLKSDVIRRICFPINTRSFWARDAIFGDFYDDNVCACAVTVG